MNKILMIPMTVLITLLLGCEKPYEMVKNMSKLTEYPKLSFPEPPKFFISGVYVSAEGNDFYSSWDTLIVSKTKRDDNTFHVLRKTAYEINTGGGKFRSGHFVNSWTASYNEAENLVKPAKEMELISVKPKEATLLIGKTEYSKIE